jgi:hypothetical protein
MLRPWRIGSAKIWRAEAGGKGERERSSWERQDARPDGQVTVRVQASGGKTFKQGTAVASAEVFGCNNVTCGSETDSEVIDLKK